MVFSNEQLKLFPEDAPDGLKYFPALISQAEEKILIQNFEELDWQEVRMHGVVARRRVAHFGLDYSYNNRKVAATEPAPDFLKPLVLKGARALGVRPSQIAETLVTKYPEGAGIGWHRDAPVFELVFGVSLASPTIMKFRRKRARGFEVYQIELAPRSAYILSGTARWEWYHAISPVKELRYSVTFRTLAEKF